MKSIIALLQLFLIFQIILSAHLLSSTKKNLSMNRQNYNGDILFQEESLVSPNLQYYVKMQQDGNIVVYSTALTNASNPSTDRPLWNSNTIGKGRSPYFLKMKNDGNLVMYDSKNTPYWASNTRNKGVAPFLLSMQNDGNLVLLDSNNAILWTSGTSGRRF